MNFEKTGRVLMRCKLIQMILRATTNHWPPHLSITSEHIHCLPVANFLALYFGQTNMGLYLLEATFNALDYSYQDLLYFHTSSIMAVFEYACCAWRHGFTKTQSVKLDAIQERAVRTI